MIVEIVLDVQNVLVILEKAKQNFELRVLNWIFSYVKSC